ncbi:MAG: hypothetical protein PHI18_00180 [bacterium]|nr:hypothetical protein [bacterium]
MLLLLILIALLVPLIGMAQEGVPGGKQVRYLEQSLMHRDPLAKVSTSSASDTTASAYWNKITVHDKPNGGVIYWLAADSLATYVVPDSIKLQERHRWFPGGSYTSWATVIAHGAVGDTTYLVVPYSETGKYYDLQLRAVMEEDDSTGTPGSGVTVRGGVIGW